MGAATTSMLLEVRSKNTVSYVSRDTVGDVLPQLLEVLYLLMIKVDLKKIQEENGSQMELYLL